MDIFCQIKEKLNSQVIDETENFYLLHDGYPLLEGHLLLIPKLHVDCYFNLDTKLLKEFNLFKKKSVSFLKDKYRQPVIFEHGLVGQTVPHAHLHLLPTSKLITNQLKEYAETSETPHIPYIYYEYLSSKKYFKPITKITPGLLTILYAKILNRPTVNLDRANSLEKWLYAVKKNYSIWQKKN